MKRLRPRTTVLVGAAIGLIGGAAVYGAFSTSSVSASAPVSIKPVQLSVAGAPAPAAPCASGQTLENGVCVVRVNRTVTVRKVVIRPAPAAIQASAPANAGAPTANAATDHRGVTRSTGGDSTVVRVHDEAGAKHEGESAEKPETAEKTETAEKPETAEKTETQTRQ